MHKFEIYARDILPRKIDMEDKKFWVKYGKKLEDKFLEIIVPEIKYKKNGIYISRDIKLNHSKKRSPYSIDFLFNNRKADLKTQLTPFFSLERYCDMNPSFSATFNKKDYERYKIHYKNSIIIFHMCWIELEGFGKKITPIHGVWMVPFNKLQREIENGSAAYHAYGKRVDDKKGNSKGSYYFDIREMIEVWRYR
jgi:hypothetical protein